MLTPEWLLGIVIALLMAALAVMLLWGLFEGVFEVLWPKGLLLDG